MSIQEVAPEQLAELFHHYYQSLAPESRSSSKPHCETWKDVPVAERNRLVRSTSGVAGIDDNRAAA